jgi:putative hemolysin
VTAHVEWILGLVLAGLSFALRAAAGGFTAMDPSRLAPMQGAQGFASPARLERAVAVAHLGSVLAAAASMALLGSWALPLFGWAGVLLLLGAAAIVSYPVLEIFTALYMSPRGGRRLAIGLFAYAPVSWLLSGLRGALRWFIERLIPGPGPNSTVVMAVRREALSALSDERGDVRTLRQAQKQLVTQVYEFSESTVGEVMVPRNRIVGLPIEATVGDAVRLAGEHQFSRYPLYRETLDQIEGVLHIHDLLSASALDAPLTDFRRPIPFAPEAKKCDELLSELRTGHHHAAVVVDEFGGTAGWVTVEDLLEELVGEIRDEHDDEEEVIRSVGRRAWLVDGGAPVDDVNRMLNMEIPEGDYETIAGFLLEEMERIPRKGESHEIEGARFTILEVDARRILKVRVERVD